jgi:alkyl hydroperoxide reductase subunit AhpC
LQLISQWRQLENQHFEEANTKFLNPKDFTFVCPTELHAFQDVLPEFEKKYNRNWCFLRYK